MTRTLAVVVALSLLPFTALFDLDFRDSKGLPYRGIRAYLNYRYGRFVSGHDGGYEDCGQSPRRSKNLLRLSRRSRRRVLYQCPCGGADDRPSRPMRGQGY